jgi:SAM-dependent methyltransferase
LTERIVLVVHPDIEIVTRAIVTMLMNGLRECDIETALAIDRHVPSALVHSRAIILGGNLFSDLEKAELRRSLARNSVLFNIENISSSFMDESYINLLREFQVWDYSRANARALSKRLNRDVHHFKLFYCKELYRIPERPKKDIDVLFYGSFNTRRSQVLDELRNRGLNVAAVFGVYGEELDELISRSKVVVNIHFYENGHFECVRVFDLLANRRVVVCEESAAGDVDHDLAEALTIVPYERLAATVAKLVEDEALREEAASIGHEAFVRRNAEENLRPALSRSGSPVTPSAAVVGSGKLFDPTLLNIDFDPRWHPDIVADITDPELFKRKYASARFGDMHLVRGWFETIIVSHVLEHLPDLVRGMTNLLDMLANGGQLRITVPYDLSYGAWQDPTHLHAFNERSWLYYCEWYWYLGWEEARFDLISLDFVRSSIGETLAAKGLAEDEIVRAPRAIDEMRTVLRKRALTEEERAYGRSMRGDSRLAPQTAQATK